MKLNGKKLFSLILLFNLYFLGFTQNNVGIGTTTPNPNSILEIKSTDKGILIPRLTSPQMSSITSSLGNNDDGLLIYNSTDNIFYYWKGSTLTWIPFPQSFTNTDNQTLNINDDSLTISNGNSIFLPDLDSTNELIDSVNYMNNTLSIYQNGQVFSTIIQSGSTISNFYISNNNNSS